MTEPVPFSATLASRQRSGDRVDFQLGEDWQQGRTAYGGVVAAVAVQAMRDVAGANWPADVSLRSLQCAFIAVVEPGPVQVQVEVLRQGRNVCQAMARVSPRGRLGTVAMGVFSADRPSQLTQRLLQRPPARAEAESLPSRPYIAGRMPPFLQHVEMRGCQGALPFSGRASTQSMVHLRLRDADAHAIPPDVLTVLLGDAPATPALSEPSGPVPTSSVTWSMELRPVARDLAGGWWRIDSESLHVDGGYVNHAARLWAPDGSLAAVGSQVVTVFG